MEKYSIETLIPLNSVYHAAHRVLESDVAMANMYKAIIESSRTDDRIQAGDILELTTQHGNYFKDAHIEKLDQESNRWTVCEAPHTPFIWLNDTKDNIRCSTGGGIWTSVPNNLQLIGKRKKLFKDWGHCGSCADGAVAFEAEVNVWEYIEPNRLYGEYTTKDYNRYYISYRAGEKGNPRHNNTCRYIGDDFTFANTDDYTAWLKTFRGVEFQGNWPNQVVVFCYKRVEKLLPFEEYNALDLPIDTRICNGIIEVKVFYDDALRTVTEYRYTNAGGELEEKGIKPYVFARQSA